MCLLRRNSIAPLLASGDSSVAHAARRRPSADRSALQGRPRHDLRLRRPVSRLADCRMLGGWNTPNAGPCWSSPVMATFFGLPARSLQRRMTLPCSSSITPKRMVAASAPVRRCQRPLRVPYASGIPISICAWRCSLFQSEEACAQDVTVDVMQERRQLVLFVPDDGFSYAGLRS